MVADLLLFWSASSANKECKKYFYVTDDGRQYEEEFTESLAQINTEALQLVQDSLDRGAKDRLNKRYTPPNQFFEALVAIDKMSILLIDSTAAADVPRYRVYSRGRCILASHMERATEVLRDAQKRGDTICGLASEATQFCCLFPAKQQPNFAGPNSIGQFA
jgi:hypothetical protein